MPDPFRNVVLDPSVSFVVQAPAGSGKTELLVRRLLTLLASVERPEDVLALTFTRKAAGEMRHRVLLRLRQAAEGVRPNDENEALSLRLAERVLRRDASQGWHLIRQPQRLRLTTIDAFALWLAARMPVLSGLGGGLSPVEDADPLYREAAIRTIGLLEQTHHSLHRDLTCFLLHLENREELAIQLIATMLARREQWLPATVTLHREGDAMREALLKLFDALIREHLQSLSDMLPRHLWDRGVQLGAYAAECMEGEPPFQSLLGLKTMPSTDASDLEVWHALATLLTTKDGKWRSPRGVNKSLGFPKGAAEKGEMQVLLETLASMPEKAARLADIRRLPRPPYFSQASWDLMSSVGRVLLHAAGELSIVFAERGLLDHTEVMMRALHALGSESDPQDLLLRLDARIHHILIDEFQDTSSLQVELVKRLTSGWEAGDGRTLFVVGDPMQSIYGFRKADVGLMLAAEKGELFPFPLKSIRLKRNFRSARGVIAWVNQAFPSIFPAEDDPQVGKVRYTESEPVRSQEGSVEIHLSKERNDVLEAEHIVALIQDLLQAQPSLRIGVLAAARSHLTEILRACSRAQLEYETIDILPLLDQQEVLDALNLLTVIYHPSDRLALNACILAPFAGLSPHGALAMANGEDPSCLEEEDFLRLQRFEHHLKEARKESVRKGWRALVEGLWLALGVPALLNEQQIANVERFFALLEEWDDGLPPDAKVLQQKLAEVYVRPVKPTSAPISLCTIHGAKGLEWDVVILPALGRRRRRDEKPLLAHAPVFIGHEERMLIAPKPPKGEDDPVYSFVRAIGQERAQQEMRRLFYVACTRARDRLILSGHLEACESGWRAAKGSLLSLMVPEPLSGSEQAIHGAPIAWQESHKAIPATPVRLHRDCIRLPVKPPCLPQGLEVTPQRARQPETRPPFDWAEETARLVGIALHEGLRTVGECGIEHWREEDQARCEALMERILKREGLGGQRLNEALERCLMGLKTACASKKGRWILSSRHRHARCEWALAGWLDGSVIHVRIDRSFIDDRGIRWLIDYKTGYHEGSDAEGFLDLELERYAEQLRLYRRLLQQLEERTVMAALYHPLLDGWRVLQDA